ncbi:flavodoxin family protein [Agromyces mariniharenae]|uniref:Flavodoxin-like domain-containing protein n=1 Tax=Agromyces mariniharenae TaxID=2604423 RepID=A0A5S4UX84_9MICO|nr:flavodoxin domain-containing protein [Agromyces mariniharenae]TYL50279.1 hypothetical protein FYC51_13730 [Agromyces mariniharenae]
MSALVIYESMFGNTRRIAEAIGEGLSEFTEVRVEPAASASHQTVDLVVVGAPTHAHSLPRAASRADAAKWAADPEKHLALEPGAAEAGVREWVDAVEDAPGAWAAYGTRVDIPRIFSGDAAAGIERRLRRQWPRPAVEAECFLVTTDNTLVEGELERAREWGGNLGRTVFAMQASASG